MNLWSGAAFQCLTFQTVGQHPQLPFPVPRPQLSCVVWVQVSDCSESSGDLLSNLKFLLFTGMSTLPVLTFSPSLHPSLSPSLRLPVHIILGELHFWAAERIPQPVAMTTLPWLHDTLFLLLSFLLLVVLLIFSFPWCLLVPKSLKMTRILI